MGEAPASVAECDSEGMEGRRVVGGGAVTVGGGGQGGKVAY